MQPMSYKKGTRWTPKFGNNLKGLISLTTWVWTMWSAFHCWLQ